jgi:hypothetical protein
VTEPAEFARTEDVLPGLEPPKVGESALKRSARRTIVQLEALGLLDDRHAVVCQLMLDLADRVDRAKDYAAANLGAQLLAAYTLLIPQAEGGAGDDWDEFVADLRRSATAARDQADARPSE